MQHVIKYTVHNSLCDLLKVSQQKDSKSYYSTATVRSSLVCSFICTQNHVLFSLSRGFFRSVQLSRTSFSRANIGLIWLFASHVTNWLFFMFCCLVFYFSPLTRGIDNSLSRSFQHESYSMLRVFLCVELRQCPVHAFLFHTSDTLKSVQFSFILFLR